jgi:hypothetical protein
MCLPMPISKDKFKDVTIIAILVHVLQSPMGRWTRYDEVIICHLSLQLTSWLKTSGELVTTLTPNNILSRANGEIFELRARLGPGVEYDFHARFFPFNIRTLSALFYSTWRVAWISYLKRSTRKMKFSDKYFQMSKLSSQNIPGPNLPRGHVVTGHVRVTVTMAVLQFSWQIKNFIEYFK